MRAAVLKEQGRFEIESSYPDPPFTQSDLRLQVLVSGICGSDLHEFVAGPFLAPMPVVLGHEFCAEVVEVGAEVHGFEKGDRAIGIIYPSCGRCEYCRHGDFTLCDMRAMGIAERNGSFAQFVSAPARQMFIIPRATPPEEAVLIEPSSVACHAIRRSRLAIGENVVVFGAGPIGLLVTALARRAGADRIAVAEPGEGRRQLARAMGADIALAPGEELEDVIMEMTESRGADVVFEASGNPKAFEAAQKLVRKQGRLVMVAWYESRRVEFHPHRILGNEIDVIASYWANDVDFRRAVSLVSSRKLDVRPLIGEHFPLDQIQRAFEMLAADRGRYAKMMLDCG